MSGGELTAFDTWPADSRLDCRGMRCPRPVVELARAAARGGGELLLLADDPATDVDVPAWCRMRGATLMASGRDGSARWFRVLPAEGVSRA
jgi:tRNA 2-thiouridine synthesizing protein A